MKLVSPGIFRGPHIDYGFLDIMDSKIRVALDLETGKQFSGDGIPLDEQIAGDAHGIRVYCLPLGFFLPPSLHELKTAARFVDSRATNLIYVHCQSGVDRTGVVIAAYRILYCDYTPRQAAREAIEQGMHVWYYWWLLQLWRLK